MEEVVVLLPGDVDVPIHSECKFTDKFAWDRIHVMMLIKEYRIMEDEFKDHTIKRKVLWKKIAQSFKKKGVNVSWELCDKKWRNLKQTFKAIYTSKRSDISKRKWEFYSELEDIFSNDPNIRCSLENFTELQEDSVEVPMSDIDHYLCNDTEVDDADSNGVHCVISTGKMNSKDEITSKEDSANENDRGVGAPVWFQEFWNNFRENEKIRTALLEKMVADVVQVEEKKCKLLEMLCEEMRDDPL